MLTKLAESSRKRQSFSIESLAVSSRHQEDERDTDSPYLAYLQKQTSQIRGLDEDAITSNATSGIDQNWNCISRLTSSTDNHYNTAHLSNYATSTPKMPSPKRRRITSTSMTPPTSSDDSSTDDMVIDESAGSLSAASGVIKTSPASTTASSAASDVDNESTCSDSSTRRKKARTAFSAEQLKELEVRYKTQKYLTAADRTNVARTLRLKEQQVKTWFQNRRMKEKRQQREDEQSRAFCLPTGGVDVSQLAAMGICPPPYHITSHGVSTPASVAGSQCHNANTSGHTGHISPVDHKLHNNYNSLPSPIEQRYPLPITSHRDRRHVTSPIPNPTSYPHAAVLEQSYVPMMNNSLQNIDNHLPRTPAMFGASPHVQTLSFNQLYSPKPTYPVGRSPTVSPHAVLPHTLPPMIAAHRV